VNYKKILAVIKNLMNPGRNQKPYEVEVYEGISVYGVPKHAVSEPQCYACL
jgi:hypothetical protein